MSKELFTPLPRVRTLKVRSDELTLPFKLEEQLGLNVGKIGTLTQLAGIKSVRIINDKSGEISKATPQIVGFNSDGSALSGAAKVSTVPISDGNLKDNEGQFHTSRWADLTIVINTEETKQRLLHSDHTLNQPQPWAKEVNKAVKKEILKAGNKHLLTMTVNDKILTTIVYSLETATIARILSMSGTTGEHTASIVMNFLTTSLFWNTWRSVWEGIEGRGHGSRLSLIVGPEIDRAIVFNALLIPSLLVKETNK